MEECTSTCEKVKSGRSKHHKETQKQFFSKLKKLETPLTEMRNPFEEESTDLYKIDTKNGIDSKVVEEIGKLTEGVGYSSIT